VDTLIVDPQVSARLIEQRRALGADKFDEVWEGVYIMAPAPNDEHQDIAGGFTEVLRTIVDRCGLGKTRPGINLASDPDAWERDYRVPDVTVFLNNSSAVCHGIFWCGPPDFVVEITSPWDKTREKLNFYNQIGAREVLIVDREPWQLELFRLQRKALVRVGSVLPGDTTEIASEVLPIRLQLIAGSPRPLIRIIATQSSQSWTV
jgi:Uma2 family endonuclease